jgi:hypothetical protein
MSDELAAAGEPKLPIRLARWLSTARTDRFTISVIWRWVLPDEQSHVDPAGVRASSGAWRPDDDTWTSALTNVACTWTCPCTAWMACRISGSSRA